MKPLNVLSLFNGISCGRLALERAGISVANYYESEIDKYAGKVSAYNWPDSVQIGDVRNVSVKDLPFIPDLLIAGSPCQGFSFAGKQLNFNDPRSALFFEFVRILKECQALNPNVLFMLENVPMKKEFQRVINQQLGVYPVEINGSLVSAQSRNRLFWSNIRTKSVGLFGEIHTDIPQPADKGILLAGILEGEVDEKYFLSERALARIERNTYSKAKVNPDKTGTINTKNNSGQLSIDSGTTLIGCVNNSGQYSMQWTNTLVGSRIRRLTPTEVCRLFNVPDSYFQDSNGKRLVSESQQYKALGNGWVVDVIAHIFSFIKQPNA